MKTAEYTGRILPNGNLEVPPAIRQELGLHPNSEVKVVLGRPEPAALDEETVQARAAIMAQLDALRERFSKMPFSLTEALFQAREEEDARL